jgi:hypothetical protein
VRRPLVRHEIRDQAPLTVTATVIIAAILVSVAGDRAARMLEGQLVARLEDNARHMLEKLDRHFNECFREARELTEDQAFVSATAVPEQTVRHLREFLRWHHEYLAAAYVSMDRVSAVDTAGSGLRDAAACWSDLARGVMLPSADSGLTGGSPRSAWQSLPDSNGA